MEFNMTVRKVSQLCLSVAGLMILISLPVCTKPSDPNTAPTAAFSISPTWGSIDSTFTFDASGCTDSEDDVEQLQVRWDWENDGIWDADWSTHKTKTHQFTEDGTYTVILEVQDSEGLISSSSEEVQVADENLPPIPSFTVTPTSGWTGTIFQFDASGSSDRETPADSLQVRWDWENDGTWDADWDTTKTASHQYPISGTYSPQLEVSDLFNPPVSNEGQVSVAENTAPTASFTIAPATGNISTVFTFDASNSTDVEDATSALFVRWDWENDGTWDTPADTTKIAIYQYSNPGLYTINLEVHDTGEITGYSQIMLAVVNTAPTASFAVSPENGTLQTVFGFDATTCTDLEDSISELEVRWDWESDGIWDTPWSSVLTETHQFNSPEVYSVLLGVKDSGGLVTETNLQVIVDYMSWVPMDSGTTSTLMDIWGSSGNDIFVVGDKGDVLHFDGSTWNSMESGTANWLWGVWGSSPTDVFAVGSHGTILHYNGSVWDSMSSGTDVFLQDVWGTSSDNVFAVGSSKTILHYDGVNWTAMDVDAPTGYGGYGIWGDSSSDVFVASDQPAIWYYNGSAWSVLNSGLDTDLRAIWGSTSSDVFAVGDYGVASYYNGASWTPFNTGVEKALRGIWGTSTADIFAVGGGGWQGDSIILHSDGVNWSTMTSGMQTFLYGVWGSSSTQVFIVGSNGTILRGYF